MATLVRHRLPDRPAWSAWQVEGRAEPVDVFTTRPDTLYGATFFVVAADAKLAAELVTDEQRPALEAYVEEVRKATDIDRLATDRPKTGVFLGVHATNPVNGERIPVWAADYVLADYGTGAIMAVPAHDQRDLDFAKAFDLPVRMVVDTGELGPLDDPDEFHDHQLVGLLAQAPDGSAIGRVTRVDHGPAHDLLVLALPDGREALVPFVKAMVPEVDLAAGHVVLTLPDGLLEL